MSLKEATESREVSNGVCTKFQFMSYIFDIRCCEAGCIKVINVMYVLLLLWVKNRPFCSLFPDFMPTLRSELICDTFCNPSSTSFL